MDNIDGMITKDEVYRLFSDFRAYIPTDIRHQMIEKVKALPSIDVGSGDWISIKEKLPEYDKSVLICYSKQQDITIAWLAEDIECFEDDDYMYYMSEVTHWMPLPEPPKEE